VIDDRNTPTHERRVPGQVDGMRIAHETYGTMPGAI
jgi:hypothetical protein